MVWLVLLHLVGFVVDLLTATRRTDRDKDLEILLLRHQLQVLQRQRPQPLRLTRWEKLTLAVLTAKLTQLTACAVQKPHPALGDAADPAAAGRSADLPACAAGDGSGVCGPCDHWCTDDLSVLLRTRLGTAPPGSRTAASPTQRGPDQYRKPGAGADGVAAHYGPDRQAAQEGEPVRDHLLGRR